jgi:signal transduction histidine kinase
VLDARYNGLDLPADAANTAYRVISEALANVIRHSHASACSIRVDHHDGALDVEIRDNGDGFDTANGHGGMGLRNIVTRAALADGTATITSIPGGGTTVSVRVPT